MDDIDALERRIAAALERLRGAATQLAEHETAEAPASAASGQAAGDDSQTRAMRKLRRANTNLQAELEALREKQARDAAELDALIAELKPLIGEDPNG
ncbi:MAG: hypothetical protein AAGE18_17045 [Pseudomonadota bacterium]